MELELSKSYESFKHFIGVLKAVCEEATLQVSETGIYVMQMDPTHVGMIQATAKPELFDDYTPPTEPEKIAINITEFAKFLDRIGKDERVKIVFDKETMKLRIQATKGRFRRSFLLATLEPFEEELPTPKIFFKAQARITTDSFRRSLKDALLVSEHVKIDYTEDALQISATGTMGDAESRWEKGSDELLNLAVEEEQVTATYTLSYLDEIIDAIRNVAEAIEIHMSTDLPCKIKGTSSNIEAVFYLAPCIGV